MVKSGEVHENSTNREIDGYIQDTDAGPRGVWTPSDDGCGIMQAIQSYFFKWLKKHIPSFIHGYKGSETIDIVRNKINARMKSLSLDGSRFDSS